MTVTVLYFAALREALGRASERIELPPEIATAGALRTWLRARGEPWDGALAESRAVRVAVDRAMASPDTPVRAGAEVAFFPPVTGG